MSKDMFRGLIIGILTTVVIGLILLFVLGLNARVINIEMFLSSVAKQGQQAQQNQTPQPIMGK